MKIAAGKKYLLLYLRYRKKDRLTLHFDSCRVFLYLSVDTLCDGDISFLPFVLDPSELVVGFVVLVSVIDSLQKDV
jgi:hypothetical protein